LSLVIIGLSSDRRSDLQRGDELVSEALAVGLDPSRTIHRQRRVERLK
jgi:hypothetical protein